MINLLASTAAALCFLSTPIAGAWIPRTTDSEAADDTATELNLARELSDNDPFASITPSRSLKWVPCASNSSVDDVVRECARLLVPRDYSDPSSTEGQFSIALVRLLAPLQDEEHYKGPFFVNYGGPGGSGTEALLESSNEKLRSVIGDGYDIVAWDPRAVGSTTPIVSCFPSGAARQQWQERNQHLRLFQANDSLVQLDAENQVYAAGCLTYSGDLLPYTGTVTAARDLARINEAYGFSSKLSYYGVSYGTVLGATFAALYPDNVERLVLDSNIDLPTWYDQIFMPETYQDADEILDKFFELCVLAGPTRCAFWFPSVKETKEAFWKIDNQLRVSPIATSAGVFDWSSWQWYLHWTLYDPETSFTGFLGLDTVMASIYHGNFSETLLGAVGTGTSEVDGLTNGDALSVVICMDHLPYTIEDVRDYQPYLENKTLAEMGMFVQGNTAGESLLCGRLNATAVERLEKSQESLKTSFPILFLNPVLDPVTPLSEAISSSAQFTESVLLISNATRHGALQENNPCILDHVRAYVSSGTLPPNGTVCTPDILPFNLAPDGTLLEPDEDSSSSSSSSSSSKKKRMIKRDTLLPVYPRF